MTWTKTDKVRPDKPGVHPTSGEPHEKFANYAFEVEEFIRICLKAIEFVKRHPSFVQHQRRLRRLYKSEL
jgi:hypothetical protein